MCNKMEYKALLWMCVLIAAVKATRVNVSRVWKPDFGWVITCSWRLLSNDSLQSVRLYEDDRQFMIFRPEVDGNQRSKQFQRTEDRMAVDCSESVPRGLVGACVLSMELYHPQTNSFTYSCEVSGERPKFLVDRQTLIVDAFVPPTDAVIEVGLKNEESERVMINCSSSGLPAPRIVWTVGGQKVPPDFTGSYSNVTSKLWHVWSALSYTHSSEHSPVCTPEINWAGETATGLSITYNSADIVKGIKNMVFASIPLLLLG